MSLQNFFVVSFEKTWQLTWASSRVRILKTLKQTETVLSSISRCLEPVKALALVFMTYYLKLKLKFAEIES